jgi:hypothetical protein
MNFIDTFAVTATVLFPQVSLKPLQRLQTKNDIPVPGKNLPETTDKNRYINFIYISSRGFTPKKENISQTSLKVNPANP